jgi:anti-sigma regulatory factor (Ser/Thr protein kinase)
MKRDEILKRSGLIRRFILGQIEKNSVGITGDIVDKFKISRQAATRYLKQMVEDGQLSAEGTTKDRVYKPGLSRTIEKKYDLSVPQEESEIWSRDFKTICEGLKENVIKICEYGFTEIVNNAIDHSVGKDLRIMMDRDLKRILIVISDNGIGIFKKIKAVCNLSDERQAILELSKGKLTTDPSKHTGQGVFFSSRAFDDFYIDSYGLVYSHHSPGKDDFLYSKEKEVKGTAVYMEIPVNSGRKLKDVFDEFASPVDENYSFDKTVVPVKLVQYEGESLLSRSQAKRLMTRVENFRTVMLDFEGIKSVGPAFADEIFRVYKSEHPNIKIYPAHASEEILETIKRAKGTVLDGHFQHIENVEKLVEEGLMEPTGMGHGVGMIGPGGEMPPVYLSYRILKRDPASLRKILPHLSFIDRQKIKNVMDIE